MLVWMAATGPNSVLKAKVTESAILHAIPRADTRSKRVSRKSHLFVWLYVQFVIPSMLQCDGYASKPWENLKQGSTPITDEDAPSLGLVQKPLKLLSGSSGNENNPFSEVETYIKP